MILAKIKPEIKRNIDTSLFEIQTICCSYISAIVKPYTLGQDIIGFEVFYGNMVKNNNGDFVFFEKIGSKEINIPSKDLSKWAGDDYVALEIISEIIGTKAIEKLIFEKENTNLGEFEIIT